MYKIAIQKNGRLTSESLKFLRSIGLKFVKKERDLVVRCGDFEVLFLRQSDIPRFVEKGIIDFGIVGKNIIFERKSKVKVVSKLGFGKCSLKIAVPAKSSIKTLLGLNGERITTSFPNLLKNFLKKNGVNAAIIEVDGSVEVTPKMGLTDAICDLVQTGSTLVQNKLIPIADVMESEAVLIANPNSKWPF